MINIDTKESHEHPKTICTYCLLEYDESALTKIDNVWLCAECLEIVNYDE